MGPFGHLVISGAVSAGCYAATGSTIASLAVLGTGVLIDSDHLFDYGYYIRLRKEGRPPVSLRQFLQCSYFEQTGKTFVPFHSYELLIIIWPIFLLLQAVPLAIWITISFFTHLATDAVSYSIRDPRYFSFFFRLAKRFDRDTIYPCKQNSPQLNSSTSKSYDPEYSIRPYELRPPIDRVKDSIIFDHIKRTASQGHSLLDIGCGMGHACTLFSSQMDPVGIDASAQAIVIATHKSKGAFIQGDAQSLPFRNDSFDYIVAKDVLEHIPDDQQVLEEILRISKNKARILMYLPCQLDGINFSIEAIVKKLTGYTVDPEVGHLRRYTVDQAGQMLEFRGIKPIRTWNMVHFSLGISALLTVKGFHTLSNKGKTNWLMGKGPKIAIRFAFKIFEFTGRIESKVFKNLPGAGFFIEAEVAK